MGGSSVRGEEGERSTMSLFGLNTETGDIHEMWVAEVGEIYDILPWHDAIVRPLVEVMNRLPAQDLDWGEFPPVIALPAF